MSLLHNQVFKPSDRMLRQFAGIWIVFFGGIALLQEYHHHRHVLAMVLGVLAATIGPFGIAWPRAIRPIFIGWMILAFPIGWTISHAVLAILFYGLFTPIACLFRLMSRDALGLRPHKSAVTYWQPKPKAMDKSNYLRQS